MKRPAQPLQPLPYKETEIQRDYRGYYLAHVLVEDDGPDYYWSIQADSLDGIHSLIDQAKQTRK